MKRSALYSFLKKIKQQMIWEAKVKLYNYVSLKREEKKEKYCISLCHTRKKGFESKGLLNSAYLSCDNLRISDLK